MSKVDDLEVGESFTAESMHCGNCGKINDCVEVRKTDRRVSIRPESNLHMDGTQIIWECGLCGKENSIGVTKPDELKKVEKAIPNNDKVLTSESEKFDGDADDLPPIH